MELVWTLVAISQLLSFSFSPAFSSAEFPPILPLHFISKASIRRKHVSKHARINDTHIKLSNTYNENI